MTGPHRRRQAQPPCVGPVTGLGMSPEPRPELPPIFSPVAEPIASFRDQCSDGHLILRPFQPKRRHG
jgi:hypothetical protein